MRIRDRVPISDSVAFVSDFGADSDIGPLGAERVGGLVHGQVAASRPSTQRPARPIAGGV